MIYLYDVCTNSKLKMLVDLQMFFSSFFNKNCNFKLLHTHHCYLETAFSIERVKNDSFTMVEHMNLLINSTKMLCVVWFGFFWHLWRKNSSAATSVYKLSPSRKSEASYEISTRQISIFFLKQKERMCFKIQPFYACFDDNYC